MTTQNWDTANITVDPLLMKTSADAVNTAAEGIIDNLTTINNTLNALRLSWTGDGDGAAALANDFNQRWTDVMTDLFGTKNVDGSGILNILMNGVENAAVNYSHTERSVANMFYRFEAALEGVQLTQDQQNGDGQDLGSVVANGASSGASTSDSGPSQGGSTVDVVTNGYYHTTSVNET
jgi:uncharacterized protein YukE